MIFDRIQRADLYHGLHPRVADALRYVATIDPGIEDGVYPLQGDDIVARVQTYTTMPESEQRWESHRAFVDVQVVLSGEEHIVYAPIDILVATADYDEAKDLVRYEDEAPGISKLTLHPGNFVILLPHDGHKPGVSIAGPTTVHKVVVKIAVW